MEQNHLLYIFHFLVQGQFHSPEQIGNHLCTDKFMCMEGPAGARLKFPGPGLGNVMQ